MALKEPERRKKRNCFFKKSGFKTKPKDNKKKSCFQKIDDDGKETINNNNETSFLGLD